MRRIFSFVLVNLGVLLTIGIVTSVLGVNQYLTESGLNIEMLLAFCAIWGMGGAFISLAISRWSAKHMFGVQLVDASASGRAGWLHQQVAELATAARLPMPEVGIYESPDINAFATGPSKSRSLVAVSSGLLQHGDDAVVKAILAHEVAHIQNGDMVTMTLIQGVINAFVMFFARIAAFAIMQFIRRDEEQNGGGLLYALIVMVLEIALTILGSLVVFAFSRSREYRADAGSARLHSKRDMIAALKYLQRQHQGHREDTVPAENSPVAALMINTRGSSIAELFSTHPALDKRIAALEKLA